MFVECLSADLKENQDFRSLITGRLECKESKLRNDVFGYEN